MNKFIHNNINIDPEFGMPVYFGWDSPDGDLYRGSKDRIGAHTPPNVIPYQPSWVEGPGLPTGVGKWIEHYLIPGQTVIGVRWCWDNALPFRIHRGSDGGFRATFALLDQRYELRCTPGKIEMTEKTTRKVLRRILETVDANGDEDWELAFDIAPRSYTLGFEDCPAVLGYAWRQINTLVHHLTGAGRDISTRLMRLNDGYGDALYERRTPPEIRVIWQMLTDIKKKENNERSPLDPDLEKYGTLEASLMLYLERYGLDRRPMKGPGSWDRASELIASYGQGDSPVE